ncbi:MAG: tRNA-intron lyase [Asgard group archaeon]|nr:tRNA-intron lyase [Asgard group archaeon]
MVPNPELSNSKKKKSSKPILTKLKNLEIIIEDHQDARIIYDNGYYGLLNKDKTLSLNFEEALHLLEREIIQIADENGVWLDVSKCARIFSERKDRFWTDYLVYKDLRNRGYIVGQGISDTVKYRLYPRGAKIGQEVAKLMICPLGEGMTINIENLDEIVTQTQSLKKKLLIACVDRLGDVSYYELQTLFN